MKRFVISVLGSTLAFAGAVLFVGNVAQAAFPGADNVSLVAQQMNPDGSEQATIGWTSYNQGSQTLDLATDPSFASGVMTSGTLPGSQNSYVWNGLQPNVTYYVRVNTATSSGLIASSATGFVLQGLAPYPPGYAGNYYYYNPGIIPPSGPSQTPDGFPSVTGSTANQDPLAFPSISGGYTAGN